MIYPPFKYYYYYYYYYYYQKKRYKKIQIKLTTLHNNKRTIELLQGCVDYNAILANQMLLIHQNNTLTRFLRYFCLSWPKRSEKGLVC